MAEKLFFSQEIINAWTDDQRVKFENDVLSIVTAKGMQEYKLTSAYRVVKVSDDTPDCHNLLNSIHTAEEFVALGADVYMNSCILGEAAYELEAGYVAVRTEDEQSLEEMLMEYLAKTLI